MLSTGAFEGSGLPITKHGGYLSVAWRASKRVRQALGRKVCSGLKQGSPSLKPDLEAESIVDKRSSLSNWENTRPIENHLYLKGR